jgi:hypothetical protein
MYGVEYADPTYTMPLVKQGIIVFRNIIADGGDDPHSGNDYPAHAIIFDSP